MENKFLLSLFTFILFSFSAIAQIQSEQGKLTLADGRVLEGSIHYYYDNPLVINIYDSANKKQTFEPIEVKEITLANGKRYVSKEFLEGGVASQMIFQVMVASDKVSFYKRETADVQYYAVKGDVIYKLENNDITFTDKTGKNYKKLDYKYVGTLTTLMQDRADLIEKIQNTKFTEQGLASIITAYNNGDVTYYFAGEVEVEKKPYWAAYAHFSNHATYVGDETTGPSMGVQVGAQYYFSAKGRNSIRIGLDFSSYEFERTVRELYFSHQETWYHNHQMLTLKYQYDFIQQEKIKLYLLVNIFEIGHFSQKPEDPDYKANSGVAFYPRLSPGAGLEYKPTDRFGAFAELNNIFHLGKVPKNFSIGVKYYLNK